MKKEELEVKLIAELAKLEKRKINIEGIVPIQKRVNKRFTSVIAKFIKSTGNTDQDGLYFVADENETTSWKCTNLSVKDIEAILAEIERLSLKVYVVTYEICTDFTTSKNIEIVTKSYEKAKRRFDDIALFIRNSADDLGWVCEESQDSIEAYEDGYAAENHKYANIYETSLS